MKRVISDRVSFPGVRALSVLATALLILVAIGCRQTIPVTTEMVTTNASDYFWSGTPYNPSYQVSHPPDTPQIDQLNLRTSFDTIVMTDGIGNRSRMRIHSTAQEVVIEGYADNAILPSYPGTTIMSPFGAVVQPWKLTVQSVLYYEPNGLLFAGTDSDGIWSLPRGGSIWVKSAGTNRATITALHATETGVIYGLSPDSIYSSNDGGASFQAVVDIRKPHVVMTSNSGTLYIGGGDIERIDMPGAPPSLFSPALPYNYTNSLRALAVSQGSLIAGVISSTSTSKLFSIPFGGSAWWSPSLTVGTSHDVHSMIAMGTWLFAGTIAGSILASSDAGHTWSNFYTNSGPSYVNSFAIAATTLYAGSSDGEIIQSLPPDTLSVRKVTNLGSPIRSMASLGPDSLVVACDSGFYLLRGNQAAKLSPPTDSIAVAQLGRLVLLSVGSDGLKIGASWQAGYLGSIGQHVPFVLTGRVVDHVDSLVLPLAVVRAPQKDVFVVRYAKEDASYQPDAALPYWIVYFAKGVGPVLSELLLTDPSSGQPRIIHKAVFIPSY